MYKYLIKSKHVERPFLYIFTAGLFLAFHYFLVTYINSTYLGKIISSQFVGLIYAIGALVNMIIILRMPKILHRYGTYKTMMFISLLAIPTLLFLAFIKVPIIILVAFILHHASTPVLLMCLDVSIEDYTATKNIGKMRGFFLTIISIASIISPLIVGSFIAEYEGFEQIYAFSALFMTLFLLTVWKNFKNISSGVYKQIDILKEIKEFWQKKDIRFIGVCNIILQFFFSWMIIYAPIYLINVAGFTWQQIGVMISITLLPFILLEIPVGELADRKFGEKEMLIIGLIVSGFSMFFFPFIPKGNFFLWTAVIFVARAGASVIETMIEGYFFKKIKSKDELIAVFRLGTPIAFIIGPLIGSIALIFIPMQFMFSILGVVVLSGVFFASRIKDTL